MPILTAEIWSSPFKEVYLQSDGVIIFAFCALKYVQATFWMKDDQRMIIRFLWNEAINTHEMTHKLPTQFDEHIYKLRTIQFWITKVWAGRQDLHDKMRTGRLPLDNLDAKILAIFDKSLFESTRSIVETLRIAHSIVLMQLHDSIDFISLHLHWGGIY
jgi:hypothetical protein